MSVRFRGSCCRIRSLELARVMGTSAEMIERTYGSLLDGAGASIAERLGAWEKSQRIDAEMGSV